MFYYHGIVYHHIGQHQMVTSNQGTPMFGLVLTILGVCGLIAFWRRRHAWLLALLWVASAALALGPVLWIGVSHEYVPSPRCSTAYGCPRSCRTPWFVKIPGLSNFREAYRLASWAAGRGAAGRQRGGLAAV